MLIDPYRFAQSPSGPSAFFAGDVTNGPGWVSAYWPSAFHHDDKTYVCWQFIGAASGSPVGGRKGVHIAAYDHDTGTWSDRYTVGNFILDNDNHGVAAIVRDADGYIHCFYGAHAVSMRYSVSTNPDDVTKWTGRPVLSGNCSYPHAVLVGSTIYVFHRDDANLNQRTIILRTGTPSSGLAAFSAATTIVDFGSDSRAYQTETYAVGTEIHFTAARADAADTERKHIYYFVYDTTTGDISNYDGSVTVNAANLPIDLSTANTSFRIFDSGSNDGAMPSFAFDSNGDAHVIFADGSGSSYALKHMMLSSGSWTTPTTIVSSIEDLAPGFGAVSTFSLVPGASGKMEAWYLTSDGDMARKVRSAAGVWGSEQIIAPAGDFEMGSNVSVLNAHADLRVVFAERSGSSTDANAELLSLYAYGDGGFITDAIGDSQVDSEWPQVALLQACGAKDAAPAFIDEGPNTFQATVNGNVQTDTAQSKFVQTSTIFDGTGDYLSIPNSSLWSVSSGDFTFEAWLRLNELNRVQAILNRRPTSGNSEWAFSLTNLNVLAATLYNNSGSVASMVGTTALSTGQWYHVALCRSGTTTRLFLNGSIEASAVQSSSPTSNSQPLAIGRDWSNPGTRDLNGWLEEIRITRAARYTANFTPPSAPFPRR